MHSRLFVISENENLVRDITENQLIDVGFCQRVADYVNEVNDRKQKEEDIKGWLFVVLSQMFVDYIELDNEKLSFKIKKGGVNYFLENKLSKLKKMLEEEPETTREKSQLLFKLYLEIRDETSLNFAWQEDGYVCYNCLDDFFDTDFVEERTYFINQVFDYHF